jgi:hypothetical protein
MSDYWIGNKLMCPECKSEVNQETNTCQCQGSIEVAEKIKKESDPTMKSFLSGLTTAQKIRGFYDH